MQHMEGTVTLTLARHEKDHGEWTTWAAFRKDMRLKYTSADSDFARWQKLRAVKQKVNESVEEYYQRYDEGIDKLRLSMEVPQVGPNPDHNFTFVENLQPTIKGQFLCLPEARNVATMELHEIRGLAARCEESVSHLKAFLNANSVGQESRPSNTGPAKKAGKKGNG